MLPGDDGPPEWLFPRPADVTRPGLRHPTREPHAGEWRTQSSLPPPLRYAVGALGTAEKTTPDAWWTAAAWQDYLAGGASAGSTAPGSRLGGAQHHLGIEIDPRTRTTGQDAAEGQLYSGEYLRLRPDVRLGVLAAAGRESGAELDTLLRDEPDLFLGGRRRSCRTQSLSPGVLPLPRGLTAFRDQGNMWRIKWLLLSPAIWPATATHPGGWLPSWVSAETGAVMLTAGPGVDKARRLSRQLGHEVRPGALLDATLVAALIPRPVRISGWASGLGATRAEPGSKSTHLAVPAGAVYYFETTSAPAATALATTLNWHGATEGRTLVNRRSTLCGEKGFGLGACGEWTLRDHATLPP